LLFFPAVAVQQAIDACGKASKRVRDLPAALVAYYVIGLSLFPAAGYENVLRWLLCGLQWQNCGKFRVSSKAALSKARQRLGEAPMRLIFDRLARPLGDATLKGSWWRKHHLVVLDGSTLALQDTPPTTSISGDQAIRTGRVPGLWLVLWPWPRRAPT
jgi:hypothetical protein